MGARPRGHPPTGPGRLRPLARLWLLGRLRALQPLPERLQHPRRELILRDRRDRPLEHRRDPRLAAGLLLRRLPLPRLRRSAPRAGGEPVIGEGGAAARPVESRPPAGVRWMLSVSQEMAIEAAAPLPFPQLVLCTSACTASKPASASALTLYESGPPVPRTSSMP